MITTLHKSKPCTVVTIELDTISKEGNELLRDLVSTAAKTFDVEPRVITRIKIVIESCDIDLDAINRVEEFIKAKTID